MFRSQALQDNGMSEWGSQVQIINQVKSFLDGKLNKLDFDEKQITVDSVHSPSTGIQCWENQPKVGQR